MPSTTDPILLEASKSWLDRLLSAFTDVRAGEGVTALLMLLNIFLLLICYSVIKTVREPLILLGGGAEVRSYAAAGQAILLMGLVPLYGWFASRVDRARLMLGVTLFFIACVELFAAAVGAGLPFVGVAFFIWVGIFNVSLVAQFWSFASDIYKKEAADRLFPIIVIGMTAGAPIGSLVAARLFRSGVTPQAILQVAAVLLAASAGLYLWINNRIERWSTGAPLLQASNGGFLLVLRNPYLRLVALLIVLLNVVNTTGEYLVARMLTDHVTELAMSDPSLDRRAYIGAFSGDYQFWVNVVAFLIQAFATSRLVKYRGLQGALLALPLIALGGYAIIAAGVSLSVTRWVKTAENAMDYSVMNTARQLLWLPTTREEKYKAKQAIDTFFVRGGDVFSALVVYVGATMLHLTVPQFAIVNFALTVVWIGVALLILHPRRTWPQVSFRPLVGAATAALLLLLAQPAAAQDSRAELLAAEQAEKSTHLHPYEPDALERKLARVDRAIQTLNGSVYPFLGSVFSGGGIAVGPGYRGTFKDTGRFDAHAAWSFRNYKAIDASVALPSLAGGRVTFEGRGNVTDAPAVAFYGTGADTARDARTTFGYRATTVGVTAKVQPMRNFTLGAGIDALQLQASAVNAGTALPAAAPDYRRTRMSAELDTRTSPAYTRRGGLYRIEWSDYRQTNGSGASFQRTDAEVRQFVPLLRENWVIALRALASTTTTRAGQDVPFFLLPDLGGGSLLRGYSPWRFRDRNRVLFSGEYRWTAGSFVDMALFLDAGTVAARMQELDATTFRKSYGIGMTLHTPSTTVARIEMARTSEGTSLVLSFSPSF